MRNPTAARATQIGELEREVMQLVWRLAPVAADRVREELALKRPLKESTVRTVLRRLEEKGFVSHTLDNRTFLYSPAEGPQQAAAKAVQKIVDWFCQGSVEQLLVGMVDAEVVDRRELQRLAEKIAKAKGEKK